MSYSVLQILVAEPLTKQNVNRTEADKGLHLQIIMAYM